MVPKLSMHKELTIETAVRGIKNCNDTERVAQLAAALYRQNHLYEQIINNATRYIMELELNEIVGTTQHGTTQHPK
jgi:hypothetical protein